MFSPFETSLTPESPADPSPVAESVRQFEPSPALGRAAACCFVW